MNINNNINTSIATISIDILVMDHEHILYINNVNFALTTDKATWWPWQICSSLYICSARDKNIIFFPLTIPICPIFTHNDIKHAKLQEVKRVSNLVSRLFVLVTLEKKWMASHILTLETWEDGKNQKKKSQTTKWNRNHMTKAIPILALVSTVYSIKGNVIYEWKRACRHTHPNSQIHPSTCH